MLIWTQNKAGYPCTEWEQDGFTVKASLEFDECADLSWIGEFSDNPKEGAIHHSDNPNTFRYFNPSDPEYAQEDYKRMMQFENGEVESCVLCVRVVKRLSNLKFNGEIGAPGGYEKFRGEIILASDYLGGIESDSGEDFLTESAQDMAKIALEEAKQTLKDLIA